MAIPPGFKRFGRVRGTQAPVDERLGHWGEFVEDRTDEARRQQGARCMGCGIPFCHQGCPLGNVIPDFNESIGEDRWEHAWRILDSTNNFPEFTGRICPAPCEAACTLSINDTPVTIEDNERDIAEMAFAEGWVVPRAPRKRTGHSVAVVGSGPAGLAASQQLARAGHRVVLLEKSDRVGGLLRYGIPDFKLEKRVIDRRLTQLVAEGVEIRTGVDVGASPRWDELVAEHDAVLVATGAARPRDLEVEGRDLDGVHLALDYLTRSNRTVAGDGVPDPILATGRHVIVLGGGDTGSDCLGTALRQGAASVLQAELFPAPPSAPTAASSWPRWPAILRTSSSQAEGGERVWGWMTTRLSGDGGVLQHLHAVPVGADLKPTGPERVFPCDLLLLAMGFLGPSTERLVDQLGLALTDRGAPRTDGAYRSTVPGVYVAGDAHRGASLVVWAISEGREAARVIDADLCGELRLPTRGRERSW